MLLLPHVLLFCSGIFLFLWRGGSEVASIAVVVQDVFLLLLLLLLFFFFFWGGGLNGRKINSIY